MSIREKIARRICPQLGKDSDRLWYLQSHISLAKRWLGHDFPIVEVVLDHLTISTHNWMRPLAEKALVQQYPRLGGVWPDEINSFREKLRKEFRGIPCDVR